MINCTTTIHAGFNLRAGKEELLFQGINVVSIPVGDLAVAKAFYGEVLELGEPVYDLPDAGWIEFGSGGQGGNIAVTTTYAEQAGRSGVTIVFDVPDCAAAVERLRAKGVRCDDPVTFPGFVVFASFYDPFGNRLQMASPRDEELAWGGAPGRIRTCDLPLRRRMLYPLSYWSLVQV